MSDVVAKMLAEHEKNFKQLQDEDDAAKKKGQLVGRYVREQIADGWAYYRIIRENKKSVRIVHVKGLGDDYRVPYWGNSTTLERTYAKLNIGLRDNVAKVFGEKGVKQ